MYDEHDIIHFKQQQAQLQYQMVQYHSGLASADRQQEVPVSREDKTGVLGVLVGLLVFGFGLGLTISKIESDWGHKIAWHRAHIASGWTQHEGTIVRQFDPRSSGGDAPATVRSVLRFKDYYGKTHEQGVRLPYFREGDVGERVQIDVSNAGNVWVPGSPDYRYAGSNSDPSPQANAHWGGPFAASSGFTPGFAIFLYTLAAIGVAAIVGIAADETASWALDFRGRVGSR